MKAANPQFNPRRAALALAVVQMFCTAFAYLRGLGFGRLGVMGDWDGLWQLVPSADLLARPLESLWALHANPPLYSVLGGLALHAAGPGGLPWVIQVVNLLAGGATAVLAFGLIWRLTRAPRWSLAVGLIVALNPALVYFQAHMLYEMMVVMLVTASAWLLHRALERGLARTRGWGWDLAAWLTVLVVLVMSRSLYHLVFLMAALAFVWPVWCSIWRGDGESHDEKRRPRGKFARGRWTVALIVAAVLAVPVGWYAKNKVQYGFFGASSWMGLGWYKLVWENCDADARAAYAAAELIEPWQAELEPYVTRPEAYREWGFDADGGVPMLNRNDFHNINVPDISASYAVATRRVLLWELRHDPGKLLRWYAVNYGFFMRPTAEFEQLTPLRGMLPWEPLYVWVLGGAVMRILFWPVILLAVAMVLRKPRTGGQSPCGATAWTVGYMVFICIYVFSIGTVFETGENERFRFGIEPLWIVLAGYAGWRLWGRYNNRHETGRSADSVAE